MMTEYDLSHSLLTQYNAFQRADPGLSAGNAELRPALHFDETGAKVVADIYEAVLPRDGNLLEVGARWKTLSPPRFDLASLTGIGVSAGELERNALLTRFVVQDVGLAPRLPFGDATFDGAFCTNFVAYLGKPAELFAEARRVLKPGAPFVLTWGRRFFSDRVTLAWRDADDARRFALVRQFFAQGKIRDEPMWDEARIETRNEHGGLFSPPVFTASAVANPLASAVLLDAPPARGELRSGDTAATLLLEAVR